MTACQRCGNTGRPDQLRLSLVNLEREARQDRVAYEGPSYDHQVRCRDRKSCDERAMRQRGAA